MRRLLLITGDLATGKTTFSNALSARYGAAVLQKDRIKEVLGDEIGFRDRAENKRLSLATVALMTHVFSALTVSGVPLILEANFRANELEKIHAAAEKGGYRVLTLVLRGEIGVLFERYCRRMTRKNRHPVHLSAPLHVREKFERYVLDARTETVPGEKVEIDASDFSYQTDEALLGRIDAFFTEE